MSITIQVGKYYRQRNGDVCGPVTLESTRRVYYCNQWFYFPDGRWSTSGESGRDLIEEIHPPVPVLPFPLTAGCQYETVKPDGSAGPVLLLENARQNSSGLNYFVPFAGRVEPPDGKAWEITSDGRCVQFFDDLTELRITRPYVAPPPPKLSERLKAWRADKALKMGEFDAIIAGVEALEDKEASREGS